MLNNTEFLIVDPARSDKSTSNLSVVYWCFYGGGVLCVRGAWFGQKFTADLPEVIFPAAYEGFAGRLIANIFVEGANDCATITKGLEHLAPAIKWNTQAIDGGGHGGQGGAKVNRIAHARDFMAKGKIVLQLMPCVHLQLSQFGMEAMRALEVQLKANTNNYQDPQGRDDFADLLGLAAELCFGVSAPTNAAPVTPSSNLVHGNLCRCPLCRKRRDDEGNSGSGGAGSDSGVGSGMPC